MVGPNEATHGATPMDDSANPSRAHLQEVIFVYDAQKWKTVAAVPEAGEA